MEKNGAESKKKPFCKIVERALEKIDGAVKAIEQCNGKLVADEYTALRAKSGHLMDILYQVGDALCQST